VDEGLPEKKNPQNPTERDTNEKEETKRETRENLKQEPPPIKGNSGGKKFGNVTRPTVQYLSVLLRGK